MDPNVKLSFRHAPLKVPRPMKPKPVHDIEQPEIKPLVKPKVKPKAKPKDPDRVVFRWYYLIPCIFLLFLIPRTKPIRTLTKLKCKTHDRQMACRGIASGTFVVEVSEKCSQSIYEVDGVPFHIAFEDGVYRVPARSMTISNIDGDCMPKAFIDSSPITKNVPFSWVTTSQHTWFSIFLDGKKVVDEADILLFKSVKHGNWVAYNFDMDVKGKTVDIKGDAKDIIYIYGVDD